MNRTGVKFQRIEEYACWFENILQTGIASYYRVGAGGLLEFDSTYEEYDGGFQLAIESTYTPRNMNSLTLWSALIISDGDFEVDLSKYIKPQKAEIDIEL